MSLLNSFMIGMVLVIFLSLVVVVIYMFLKERAYADKMKYTEELTKANRMKTRFVQNMSHEVRTPLNAIVGFAQLMGMPENGLSDEEKAQYAEYVTVNSSYLTMLVDDILALSDANGGQFSLELSSVTCGELVENAIKGVSYRIPPEVKLVVDMDTYGEVRFETDARRVQQILTIFLSSACENTKVGDIRLRCSTKDDLGYVVFSVTDEGASRKETARAMKDDIEPRVCITLAERLGGTSFYDFEDVERGVRYVLSLPL